MLHDYKHKFMLTHVSELEYVDKLIGAKDVFIDFETTSGHDKKNSLNPWKNCDILGIGITADDYPNACYIPLRHRESPYNLPVEPVYIWLREVISNAKRWINHNVKYDAQVGINCVGIDISHLELCDTVTFAKLIDSDRFSFTLTALCRDWLKEDISVYEREIHKYTHTPGGNWQRYDYAVIPADVMHSYACQDVLSVRRLWHHCIKCLPEECEEVWEAEKQLTKVLLNIERRGLALDFKRVHDDAIKYTRYKFRLMRLLRQEVEKEYGLLSTGIFEPHINAHCAEVFLSKMGLPMLDWSTQKGKVTPRFGKEVLKSYLAYPGVSKRIIKGVMQYRYYHKLLTSFTEPYIENHVDLIIHPSFNQTVRTGRLSCSEPNMQQLSPAAKRYIKPSGPDEVLIEFDLSQIEYRYIAHYIDNPRVIAEYQENPEADFHQMMADLCGIKRKMAKNINFAVSFGAGKKKTIAMLKGAFDIEDVPDGQKFETYCERHGLVVYNDYHQRLPELKNTSKTAERVCKRRGYVKNAFGRRRRLPANNAYRAFNTVIQSSAADLFKRITIRLEELTNGTNAKLLCLVHDSWIYSIPKSEKEYWKKEIKKCIESTESKMCIPIYSSCEVSDVNWRKCREEEVAGGDEGQERELART